MNKGFPASREDLKFLAITCFLVILMGATAFSSMTLEQDFKKDEISLAKADFGNEKSNTPKNLSSSNRNRNPASVTEKKPVSITSKTHTSVDFNFHCGDRKPASSPKVATQLLQIKGRFCGVGAMKVFNESNGYTATLFQQSGKYTTDFIQLVDGKNRITVSDQGQSQTLEIEYSP